MQETEALTPLEERGNPVDFLIYWVGLASYSIIIKRSMEYAFSSMEFSADELDLELLFRALFFFGYNWVIAPTLWPVIIGSALSYLSPFFFGFGLEFFGKMSRFSVYFLTMIFSYGDDIIWWLLNITLAASGEETGGQVYDFYPKYFTSFIVKTFANFAVFYVVFAHYSGWKEHREFEVAR